MGMDGDSDCERPDFGALYVVGAYLSASLAEAHHLLSALALWPENGAPLALDRRQWRLLAVMRELREALEVSWDELALAWIEYPIEGPHSRDSTEGRFDVDRDTPLAGSGEELLPTLARWLRADPAELTRLIEGHGRLLGLEQVPQALDASPPTFRAVRRLWWLKTRLGVTVDEFLALESCLQSDAPADGLLLRECPAPLLRAARLVRWSRHFDLPLFALLTRP